MRLSYRLPLIRALIVALSAMCAVPAAARRQQTGPQRLSVPAQAAVQAPVAAVYDTVACPPGAIVCSGYDKPNSATRETFFVSNHTADSLDVEGIILTFDYSDMKGRRLHSRRYTLRLHLPAGETRAADVPTWDRNRAFHYFRSEAPLRRRSSPYKVSVRVDSLIVGRAGAE